MIKFDNIEVFGFESAMRGMRNARRSWKKNDSDADMIGDADLELAMKLVRAGNPSHCKFRRMIVVYVDITAPMYWWKQFDTYKVGTVANSTSSMWDARHRDFDINDFSTEGLTEQEIYAPGGIVAVKNHLNYYRRMYIADNDILWINKIEKMLPMCYNQLRTIFINYEILANIYKQRKNHPISEWKDFIDFIQKLPFSELIVG